MNRVLACLAMLVPMAAAQGAALVLAGGTVIDGYGNPPIPDGIIVIEGDRILAVGGVGQVAIPEGAEIISTEGMTVLPGLWDMQVSLMRLGHGDSARWNETYGPLARNRGGMPIAERRAALPARARRCTRPPRRSMRRSTCAAACASGASTAPTSLSQVRRCASSRLSGRATGNGK